jgi:glyceraldehyde 3-phosphate dehydrogenase
VFRAGVSNPNIEFVGINDLVPPDNLAYLLRHDSTHGRFKGSVEAKADGIVVNGKFIQCVSIKNPAELPWGKNGANIVVESTGLFTDLEGASNHLKAGAQRVVISAPTKAKDEEVPTLVMGVNHNKYDPAKHKIVSNASCTTNCLVPMVQVIRENFGFKHGSMVTIHSYTNDQNILDLPHKDLRRARAAALSIIPTSTGAAKATSLVIPEVKGLIDGIALRVPTADVSLVDLTCTVERGTTVEDVNNAFREAAAGALKGVLFVNDDQHGRLAVDVGNRRHPGARLVLV